MHLDTQMLISLQAEDAPSTGRSSNDLSGLLSRRSSETAYSIASNLSVGSNKEARKNRSQKNLMKCRVYSKDLLRWFVLTIFDPEITTVEDVKVKIFMSTGLRPHCEQCCAILRLSRRVPPTDQRLWISGEPLRNDFVCTDLPFYPYIRHGDPGILVTTFIAVDDNTEGFRCDIDASSFSHCRCQRRDQRGVC